MHFKLFLYTTEELLSPSWLCVKSANVRMNLGKNHGLSVWHPYSRWISNWGFNFISNMWKKYMFWWRILFSKNGPLNCPEENQLEWVKVQVPRGFLVFMSMEREDSGPETRHSLVISVWPGATFSRSQNSWWPVTWAAAGGALWSERTMESGWKRSWGMWTKVRKK